MGKSVPFSGCLWLIRLLTTIDFSRENTQKLGAYFTGHGQTPGGLELRNGDLRLKRHLATGISRIDPDVLQMQLNRLGEIVGGQLPGH